MPSQENIQFCESTDTLNQMLCYENDLKSQLHHSFRLKNDSVEQTSSLQSNKGFPQTDNNNSSSGGGGGGIDSDGQLSTHELNFETVCVHIYIFIYIHMVYSVCMQKKKRKKNTSHFYANA